ncbi:MAG: Bax inhibitor-1/YccA family protein [Planctomycetes bacterium]|nr:Bax inhibitor-1/YccA family protein [Planctomycetota bacterium]
MFQSSNPALRNEDTFQEFYGDIAGTRPAQATLQGVVNKTGILVLIAVAGGAAGYQLAGAMPAITWISAIAAFVIVLGFGFVLCGKPQLSPILAPIYAIVEGIFLGALTAALDSVLAKMPALEGAVAEGQAAGASVSLAMPAFIITISVMLVMLALYSMRILRPTRRFTAVVSTAVGGIMLTYLLMFVLSMFGVQMPFLSLGSAFGSGYAPLIGIGLNVLILGVAALVLIIDFGRVEAIVEQGSPKYMEWYAGFALLVTLAWIYFEAVKLVFRLYLLFGSRD